LQVYCSFFAWGWLSLLWLAGAGCELLSPLAAAAGKTCRLLGWKEICSLILLILGLLADDSIVC